MITLDDSQRAAVKSQASSLVIVAGAGSGKTRVFTARILHIIDSGYSPGRILAMTFTRLAAKEIKERIDKARPGLRGLTIGTFHSVFFKYINEFAPRLGYKRPITPYDEWFSADVYVDEMITMGLPYTDKVKNENLRGREPKKIFNVLRRMYEIDRHNWERVTQAYQKKLKKHNAVGYDEMLTLMVKLLENHKDVRIELHNLWHWILIDEAQDTDDVQMRILELLNPRYLTAVGDDGQCVDSETIISTPYGDKKIIDLRKGDTVYGYRNGGIAKQLISEHKKTTWKEGICITTENGKQLLMSPNHKIWVDLPILKNSQHIVYLMYRSDLGFRIGKTNKCITKNGACNFGQRAVCEGADKLWIIDIVENNEDALFYEEKYSLTYGIPTYIFNATKRGLNQERANKLFAAFGDNGFKLLDEKNLDFNYPHWIAEGVSGPNISRERYRVNLLAHSKNNNTVAMEWTGDCFDSKLSLSDIHIENNNRRRIRKYFANYTQAKLYAKYLSEATGAFLRERIVVNEDKFMLITASGLQVSMKVLVKRDSEIKLEKIINVERKVPGNFNDLQVDDCANFFGNNILSHNSIYEWRGAKPDGLIKLAARSTTIHLDTNYRSTKAIIEASNLLLGYNKKRIPREIKPTWYADDGICKYQWSGSEDTADDAAALIKDFIIEGKYGSGEMAVLCRTNRLAKQVSQSMRQYYVPHKLITRGDFWDIEPVRCMVASLILLQNLSNNQAWNRAINFPYAKLTPLTRAAIKKYAAKQRIQLFQATAWLINNEVAAEQDNELVQWTINYAIIAGRYYQSIRDQAPWDAITCLKNLNDGLGWLEYFKMLPSRMVSPQAIFDRIILQMKSLGTEEKTATLGEFIEWYAARDLQDEAESNLPLVTVCTIHAAKGLEWAVVVLPGWSPDTFPTNRTINEGRLEEERRLAYVAITRAANECYVLGGSQPCQFVDEAELYNTITEDEDDDYLT